jgi:hypothetical protein
MQSDPLFSLAIQAEQRSFLLAPRLRAYLTREQIDARELAARLGCSLDVLPRLWLCELPRAEQFAEDVERIAAFLGIEPEPLAQIIAEAMRSR